MYRVSLPFLCLKKRFLLLACYYLVAHPVGDKDPSCLGIALDSLGDMGSEVGFGACGSNAGCHDLSAGDIQIGDQRLGTMALVFEFLTFNVAGLHGQGGVETF